MAPAAAAPPAPTLERRELPATGRTETLLAVPELGRYALRVTSPQGSALEVVDRMAGSLGKAGEPGKEDGRLDLFLDRGSYKVVVQSDPHGKGVARLSTALFHEVHPARRLVERRLIEDSLDDGEQISWWLSLSSRRAVRLEAAGRNLAEIRLWQAGAWMVDALPHCAAIQPTAGRPLLRCEMALVLGPGLYRLDAYGGVAQPWSEAGAGHPLYLRWGFPRLAESGRRRYLIGPFGEDRYEVPRAANFFRIELPEARPVQLAGGLLPLDSPLPLAGDRIHTAEVTKKSVPPVAELELDFAKLKQEAGSQGGTETPETTGADRRAPSAGEGSDVDPDLGVPADPLTAVQARAASGAAAGGEAEETAATAGQEGEGEGAAARPPAGESGQEEASAESAAAAPEAPESADDTRATGGGAGAAGDMDEEAPDEADQAAQPEGPEAAAGEEAGAGTAGFEASMMRAGNRPWSAETLWLSVSGEPGQPYVLQHFENREKYPLAKKGRFWVATVHTGHPEDSPDATALVVQIDKPAKPDDLPRPKVVASAALRLDREHPWARRFNLLAPLRLFLEVKELAKYEVVATGTAAKYRIVPFALQNPAQEPPLRESGASWELDPGFYVLEAFPEQQGIVTVGVRVVGTAQSLLAAAEGRGSSEPPLPPLQAAARFGPLELDPRNAYFLFHGLQPGVSVGVVLRRWPLDLRQPLPLTLAPGETVSVDARVEAAGTLGALGEDGVLLEISLDGGPWQRSLPVAPDPHTPHTPHTIAVRNGGKATASLSLGLAPPVDASADLPPPPSPSELAALPQPPPLETGKPRLFDLGRGESTLFLVRSERPALYQIETTGLLATRAALRTRIEPSLAGAEANGVGRNALVRQYLREGDYQVTIAARGRSAGHLGVRLATAALRDAGQLRLGTPAHLSLPPGEGAVFGFAVARRGVVRIQGLGARFPFGCRLEDAGGWPIGEPERPADFDQLLEAGSYRLVLLPQPVAARALVLVTAVPEPLHLAGHGPHELPLGKPVEHLWLEPEPASGVAAPPSRASATDGGAPEPAAGGAVRPPDLWRFSVPARMHVAVSLDEEMEGTLARLDERAGASGPEGPQGAEVSRVPPGRAWRGELAAGRYQLAAVCSRRNSHVTYHVSVVPEELAPGLDRVVSAPLDLPVAVAAEGLFEITSLARADLRARLYAPSGELIAAEDDRPDDWNFLILQRLAPAPPGTAYRLRIEPVAGAEARLRIAMRAAAEVVQAPLALPFHGEASPRASVLLYPLPTGRPGRSGRADLLLAAASSQESLGLALERRPPGGPAEAWQVVASATGRGPHLEVPLEPGAPAPAELRLRLWSLDHQGLPVRLSVAALATPEAGERQLRRGVVPQRVPGFDPPLGALAVRLDGPGLLRLSVAAKGGGPAAEPAGQGASSPGSDRAPVLSASGAPWRPLSPLFNPVAAALSQPPHARDGLNGRAARGSGGAGEEGGEIVAASGDRLWLVADLAAAARVSAERVTVAEQPVSFEVFPSLPPIDSGPMRPGAPAASSQQAPPRAPLQTSACDLAGRGGGPVVVFATAPSGQPGVLIAEKAGAGTTPPGEEAQRDAPAPAWPAGSAVSPHTAIAVSLHPESPTARVWQADPSLVTPEQMRLSRLTFPPPTPATAASPAAPRNAGWGAGGGTLTGVSAREIELPAGRKSFRLAFGEATIGVLSQGDRPLSTHWQGGQPFEESLVSTATRLTLLHTREAADPYSFELLPAAAPPETPGAPAPSAVEAGAVPASGLASGLLVERSLDATGVLRLPLPPSAAGPWRVHLRGAGARALLLDSLGAVSFDPGPDFTASPSSVLLVSHRPGVLLAWLEAPDRPRPETAPPVSASPAAQAAAAPETLDAPDAPADQPAMSPAGAFWPPGGGGPGSPGGTAPSRPPPAVTPPAVLPLAGNFSELALSAGGPVILHLRTACPAVSLLEAGAEGAVAHRREIEVHERGVRVDAFLPSGEARIGLRSLAGIPLSGTLEITTSPVQRLGEGAGPAVLLPAGGVSYFSFHVARAGAVGIGVQASSEAVECSLLDGAGRELEARPAVGQAGARPGGEASLRGSGGAPFLVRMASLAPGDYLLAVRAPLTGAPLRVRPALAGLAQPDTGPPADVVRHYLELAAQETQPEPSRSQP